MNTNNWKYVKPLNDPESIEKFEKIRGVKFPEDLRNILKQYNGGRPVLNLYDTAKEKNKEFKTLLSFNNADIENIYKYENVDSINKAMIPFASDSIGNLFVLKDGKIFFWDHEIDSVNFLSDTFTAFLNMLHK